MDDCGAYAAAKTGLEIYEQASRGSGRTHRMIKELPDKVMVCHTGDGAWIRNMIRDSRGREFQFTLAKVENWKDLQLAVEEAARYRLPTAVDHHVVTQLYLKGLDEDRKRFAEVGVDLEKFSAAAGHPSPVSLYMRNGDS